MNLSCVFDPAACVDQAVTTWVNWFPFGIEGVIFTVGLICGAALGRFGVAAVIGLAVALKVAGKTPEPIEHVTGKDAAPPVSKPKKRKTIFDGLGK